MEGYVRLYRKLLVSECWTDINARLVFIWCLLRANWKSEWLCVGKRLKPGQFATGRDQAAKECGIGVRQWRTAMTKLEQMKMIETEVTSKGTIISIYNWGTYQLKPTETDQLATSDRPATDQLATSDRPASDQLATTIEEGLRRVRRKKKDKKEKKREGTVCPPPRFEEVAEYCKERGNLILPDRFIAYYQARGWTLSRGQPMRDWKAAVRAWETAGLPDQKKSKSKIEAKMESLFGPNYNSNGSSEDE